jgi:hypothetical protein
MNTLFNISKTYVGYDSRNVKEYEVHNNLSEAKHALEYMKNRLIRFGGDVLKTDSDMTFTMIDESTGGDIIYEITEGEPKTYDVVFNSDEDSDSKGFQATEQYCRDYIAQNNGTNNNYFADYKGGTVSVWCNETNQTVYYTDVN